MSTDLDLTNVSVLIADDSPTMRQLLADEVSLLRVNKIFQAVNGHEAVEIFEAEHPDVVLTDWNMPELDGLGVLQHIRESGATVPVIMITTECCRKKVVGSIQAGVSDYVIKPFKPKALAAKLLRILECQLSPAC